MRQAIVVIHGIGEQRPMGTIRPFVKAILEGKENGPKYFSKPDSMSKLFELRRLQESTEKRSTHFYEYYWAYNVEGTKIWDVFIWLFCLILRRKFNVPKSARGLWRFSRILVIIAFVLGLAGGWAYYTGLLNDYPEYKFVWLLGSGLALAIQYILIFYLGDAARYLSPRPRNIKLRQKIRRDGVELLRTLHESRQYDRIIIVGHSLGSVIAYDIITHLWRDYNDVLPEIESNPDISKYIKKRLDNQVSAQPMLENVWEKGEKLILDHDAPTDEQIEEFHTAQLKAWKEQRSIGCKWKITDFVTLGSPLAHSMLLLAANKNEFEDRKQERELITCPPQPEGKGYAYNNQSIEIGNRDDRSPNTYKPYILHHAAPFAVTRWTNLYFPAKLGLFGDVVGGKLSTELGYGIKDVPVLTSRWYGLANLTPVAHTSYWRAEDAELIQEEFIGKPLPALYALKHALLLDEIEDFKIKSS